MQHMANHKDRVNRLYADGGVVLKNPSPLGGTWAYCMVTADGRLLYEDYDVVRANKFPAGVVTNNQMELLAVIRGLQTLRREMVVHVCSDSEITLGRLFKGYAMENIPEWMVNELNIERGRLHQFKDFKYTLISGHPTKLQLETGIGKHGHPTSEWNMRADELCHMAAEEYSDRWRLSSGSNTTQENTV